MTYGITINKSDTVINLDKTMLGGRVFVQLIKLAAGTPTTTYTYDSISSHTHLQLYIINAGAHTITTSTVALKATVTLTPSARDPGFGEATTVAVFTKQTTDPSYGISMVNDSGERLISSAYSVPEFLGKITLNSTAASYNEPAFGYTTYAHFASTTVPGTGRERIVFWSIPEHTNDIWITAPSYLAPADTSVYASIVAPNSLAYNLPEAFVFALNPSLSTDSYGVRVYSDNSTLLFDAGSIALQIKGFANLSYSSTPTSTTSTLFSAIGTAILIPGFSYDETLPVGDNTQSITYYKKGMVRRVGSTVYAKLLTETTEPLGGFYNYTYIYGTPNNPTIVVDGQALGAASAQPFNASIVPTNGTGSGITFCNYDVALTGTCNTTQTFSASTSGGTAAAITYSWSVSGTQYSITGGTTSSTCTVVNNGNGTTTYSGTLSCTVVQSGVTKLVTYTLSHLHTAVTNPLTGTISTPGTGTTCTYNPAVNTTCNTTQSFTITPSGGTGTGITYAWSISGAGFYISTSSGNTCTVKHDGTASGTAYGGTLTCTMTQSGTNVPVNYTLSHQHSTVVTPLAASVTLSSGSPNCNYDPSLIGYCTTTQVFSANVTAGTGTGASIGYLWSVSGTGFSISSSSGNTCTVVNSNSAATWNGSVSCAVSQSGSTTVNPSYALSHIHSSVATPLTGTISTPGTGTTCTYNPAVNTTCNTTQTFTITPSGGTGAGITYVWSISGAGFYISTSSGNTCTVKHDGSAATWGGTLTCTMTQSGTNVPVNYTLSHQHSTVVTPLAASVSLSSGSPNCNYDPSLIGYCTTTQVFSANVTAGTGTGASIGYLWSVSGTGFSISSSSGNTCTVVNSNSAATWNGSVSCAVSQSGSTTVNPSYTLSHTHNSVANPLTGTISTPVTGPSCTYDPALTSTCISSHTLTITPSGGNGTGITYAWSITGTGFSISGATNGTSCIVQHNATAGTAYPGSVTCTMTQSGSNFPVYYTVYHTHISSANPLTANVTSGGGTLVCSYDPSTLLNCPTSETFNVNVGGGDGTSKTFSWSVSGTGFYISGPTNGTSCVVKHDGSGPVTYTGSVLCVVSQSSTTLYPTYSLLSHAHNTTVTPLTASISTPGTGTTCNYNPASTGSCSTSQTFNVSTQWGTGKPKTYLWSVTGSGFYISGSTSGTSCTVNHDGSAATWGGSVSCAVSQEGSTTVTPSYALSHAHSTVVTPLAAAVNSTGGSTACSYDVVQAGSCNTTQYFSITPTPATGTGAAIGYSWSITGTGFSISGATNGTTCTVVHNGNGTNTYGGTLYCTVSQQGSTTIYPSYTLSHVHTATSTPLTGSITATGGSNACQYNAALYFSCNTTQTFSVSSQNGDNTAKSYSWSVTGAGFSINGATNGTTCTVVHDGGGTNTYGGTLYCTVSQTGYSTTPSYTLSHTHTSVVTPISSSITDLGGTLDCQYNAATAGNCLTSQSFYANYFNGDGTNVTYNWYVTGTGFYINGITNFYTATVSNNQGGTVNYTGTVYCGMTQSGITTTASYALGHLHTANVTPMTGSIAVSSQTASCEFTTANGSCVTSEVHTVNTSGGDGQPISYSWSIPTNTGNFSLSSTTGQSVTVSKTAGAGTYTCTVQCAVTQSGNTINVQKTVSHTHTYNPPPTLSTLGCANTLYDAYTESLDGTGSPFASSYFFIYRDGTWNIKTQSGGVPTTRASGTWISPSSSTVGDGYYVKFTRTFLSNTGSTGTGNATASTTSWLQINATTKSCGTDAQVTVDGDRVVEATYTIDISANQSTVLSSTTGVQLNSAVYRGEGGV